MKFNDRFKARRDQSQWILTERYMGRATKGKEAQMQSKDSYHSNLRQVCNTVIDRMAGECKSASELVAMLDKAGWMVEGWASGWQE